MGFPYIHSLSSEQLLVNSTQSKVYIFMSLHVSNFVLKGKKLYVCSQYTVNLNFQEFQNGRSKDLIRPPP